ncbi:hypothetical protein DENIS_1412 [Desulfonema ishimotonii]|uniref:Uncharacterized protein n=1 Tax=Desulfonema ishimotonii TaxID=45657 RepID=A0A401FU11_9BACT|nr:hypothetical protein [Desulfonema ishimotonii]GBC60459.1 hypothetical protein DENIS_1412 [Desulfonema ishimotonii]
MGILRAISIIRSLCLDGGFDICTGPEDRKDSGSGDSDASPLLRTVILPDGNTLFYVSETALGLPALCQIHFEKVAAMARSVANVRWLLKLSAYLVWLTGGGMISLFCWEGWQGVLKDHLIWAVVGVLCSVPSFFIRKIAMTGLRIYFRRKVAPSR